MKKAFLTLCFLVSASFAMANTIENEQPAVHTIEEAVKPESSFTYIVGRTQKLNVTVKPNGTCGWVVYDVDKDGNYYIYDQGVIDCGPCTDAQACKKAAWMTAFVVSMM